ncbi:MAG: minor capsid protein [Faecalibacterium prausnitzii]|nr:minor capsid protein [Faecalibacterium prausnitzii]MDY2681579.1 minor capsid protein [Faecalibacterium prausnitzii]
MAEDIRIRLTFRPGFARDRQAAFERAQFAFSQKVAAVVDPYVPFDTGTLKNSVRTASDFKGGMLVYNTPYARRQYYLHPQGEGLHGDSRLRGSYWGQRALADHKEELVRFAKAAARNELGGDP